MKLTLAFQKAFSRFKPEGWLEQQAMKEAPNRFNRWIMSISDAEAEEIRVEMVTTLL